VPLSVSVSARTAAIATLAAVAYYAASQLGYAFMIPQGVANIWPAAGVMLGLLLVSPKGDWPALLAGGFAGSVVSDLARNLPAGFAISASAANVAESLVGALFVRRVVGERPALDTLRGVIAIAGGAAVACNAVTALAGAAALNLWRGTDFVFAWLVWFVGDGLGILIATPAVIVAAGGVRRLPGSVSRVRALEGIVLFAALAAAVPAALGPRAEQTFLRPYTIFPLLFWAACRFGTAGASLGLLLVAAVAVWHGALGTGRFVSEGETGTRAAIQLYLYLSTASLWTLVTAALFAERQAAASRLSESEERYRSVVETAADGIFVIDASSRILFANAGAARLFGYTIDELRNAPLTQLMPERYREAHLAALARHAATGERRLPRQSFTFAGLHRDGHEFPIDIAFGDYFSAGRRVFTGIVRDISEQRALEAQYRQAQKMEAIGQLAGGIAHDFNNLLTAILGYASTLRERLAGQQPHEAELHEIERAGERAAALTRQLLAFGRRQILDPRPLRLDDAVRKLEAMLRRLLPENIAIVVRAQPGIRTVHADPGQIEQVIMNLAVNARDAMPQGGTLAFEIANDGDAVVLAVRDTGIGMDRETLARAFDPFFTTKPVGQGTGLGLATVDGIVRQSGGHVSAESEPGAGTVIRIALPAFDAPVQAAAADARSEAPRGGETILLVEDERSVRALIARVLEKHGYRVLEAGSPSEALAVAEQPDGAIQLLLTDVVMPEMNGRELADELTARHPGVAVLFMSGYTDTAIAGEGVLEPGTPFIQKPFTTEALLKRVRHELDLIS